MAIKWEYKTLVLNMYNFWKGAKKVIPEELEVPFNDLGMEGWELVSVFDTNVSSGDTHEIVAVFKRKIS